jgi:hypothetical protein
MWQQPKDQGRLAIGLAGLLGAAVIGGAIPAGPPSRNDAPGLIPPRTRRFGNSDERPFRLHDDSFFKDHPCQPV